MIHHALTADRDPGVRLVAAVIAVSVAVGASACSGSSETSAQGVDPAAAVPETTEPSPQAEPTDHRLLYHRDPAQSIYGNIRRMIGSGQYPQFDAELQAFMEQPIATWLGPWLGDNRAAAERITTDAEAAHEMPVLVVYNIPDRDLGEFSAGGAYDAESYAEYIVQVSEGVGDRNAVLIVEPDALAGVPDMSKEGGEARIKMLREALLAFAERNPNAYLYLDAGNSTWLEPEQLASLLHQVYDGIAIEPRISLNVSNYRPTAELQDYLTRVEAAYGSRLRALFDTGNNGAAVPPKVGDWCNPPEARLGHADDAVFDPTAQIEQIAVRVPGESSGDCGAGQDDAGEFSEDLMLTLLGSPTGKYASHAVLEHY